MPPDDCPPAPAADPDRVAAALDRIARTEARLAAQQALLDERLLRVERNRLFTAWNTAAAKAAALYRRARRVLAASGVDTAAGRNRALEADYAVWVAHERAELPGVEQMREGARNWSVQPLVSVVMVAQSAEYFGQAVRSVWNQMYENWELCVAVEDGGTAWALPAMCGETGSERTRHATTAPGTDAARALNLAADLATGRYLWFLEDTGVLSAFALYRMVEALQQSSFEVFYSDEDELDGAGRRMHPKFKPDWSPHLLTSCLYTGRSVAVDREHFLKCGGFRPDDGDARFHGLVLRLAEAPIRVHHCPRVLYHVRAGEATGGVARPESTAAHVIEATVKRHEGREVDCVPGPVAGTFVMRPRTVPARDVTAVVCSRSPRLLAKCLQSLRATAGPLLRDIVVVAHEESGPNQALRSVIQQNGAKAISFGGRFHFAAMNNMGAAAADTPYLLFLNDDVTATSPHWAELLIEQAARERVAAAGAVLWYPSGDLQHAGIVVGIGDGAGHIGRHSSGSELWPWLLATRDVSAVTGACMAMRTAVFNELGGFDPDFPNNYNDVDLCLRARARGYAVVCVAATGLIHAECQTRPGVVRFEERYRFYRRWADVLGRPDPYYSTALSPTEAITLNLNGDEGFRSMLAGASG